MRIALAFLRRDALIWSSYRLAAMWQMLGLLLTISLMYFLGMAVGENPSLGVSQAGSYAAFILSGIAFTDVILQGLSSVPQAVRENQKAGTLESMLLTPMSAMMLVLSSTIFNLVLAIVRMVIIILVGTIVLGFWRQLNVLTLVIILVPSIVTFIGLGSLSAAFIMLVKQGDPVVLAYGAISALLGGVLFPVQVLPAWVQPLSTLVPLTHALTGLRVGLEGGSPAEAGSSFLVLFVTALGLFPLGIAAFNWAVNRAKQEGSLVQY